MHMTSCKRWDVVVTRFPFVDKAAVRRRPAVCIASMRPKNSVQLYWVLMVTSTELKGWRGDCEVHDLKKAGLPIPSIVRTAKIACVDESVIERRVGKLDEKTRRNVSQEIRSNFSGK